VPQLAARLIVAVYRMNTEIEVEGAVYELAPAMSQDSAGVSLVVSILRRNDRVAQLRFRCAIDEPTYIHAASLRIEDMLNLVLSRETMATSVRSALNWQSEVERINPGGVSPLILPLFPENYAHARDKGNR
jgi:hypothetical protein